MSEFEIALTKVKDVYINYPKKQEDNQKALLEVEQEIQDLLHVIEFHNFNASKGYELAKELKDARLRRRTIKNELELLAPVKDFLTYVKPTEKNITKTITELKAIHEKQQNRTYRMRRREDLQELLAKRG